MDAKLNFRRVIAILLLLVAVAMVLMILLPAVGMTHVSFYRGLMLPFAAIIFVGAWILWRGWNDPVDATHETLAQQGQPKPGHEPGGKANAQDDGK